MPQRFTPLIPGNFYHIYNRGVEKRQIYMNDRDYQRFLETIYYYQFSGPKPKYSTIDRFKTVDFESNPKIVDVICYCLMPNHFHLLIRPLREGAVQEFMKNLSDSYTRYFNTKHTRVGSLFQGAYKAVLVETDEQLLHLSRYIHINPHTSGLVGNLVDFTHSSYLDFINRINSFCVKEPILDLIGKGSYKEFVEDYTDYALSIARIKDTLIDPDE